MRNVTLPSTYSPLFDFLSFTLDVIAGHRLRPPVLKFIDINPNLHNGTPSRSSPSCTMPISPSFILVLQHKLRFRDTQTPASAVRPSAQSGGGVPHTRGGGGASGVAINYERNTNDQHPIPFHSDQKHVIGGKNISKPRIDIDIDVWGKKGKAIAEVMVSKMSADESSTKK